MGGQSKRNGEAIEGDENGAGNEEERVQGEEHDEEANQVCFVPIFSQLSMFAWRPTLFMCTNL